MMNKTVLCLLLVAFVASAAWAQDYLQDFEQGLGGALSYHKAPDDLKIELGSTGAASGKQYARAVLPGKKALEGFYVTATGLSGARLATATAQVRGQGELWLCLISGNGWLYSPQTVTLTDKWQEVSLSKALLASDRSLGVYFISRTAQPGAVYEVDNVRVTLAPAPQTYDTAAGPWRLEAEDFAQRAATVTAMPDALGGQALAQEQYAATVGLPCPRTSRPVTLYLRVRAGSPGDTYRLLTQQGGNTQYLQTLKARQVGQWEWLHFAPMQAGEVGESFGIACLREKEAAGLTALDSVVIATQADLQDAQLAAAPLLFGRRPLAVVARTTTSPVLDGKPDDACWQNTVACSSFMGVGSSIAAEGQTVARLCYDERNLYALFTCTEPILSTAQQRRHEFLAKVTQRDAEVYADDSAILLLDPTNTGKSAYDFTVNALGTIADARGSAPDLWETRDLKWNSQAQAKGQIGEGVWYVEIAIPLADLGGTPQPGAVWQACLGRIAKARKESSSWNLSDKGFHDPVEFGALVFGGAIPGVVASAPNSLQIGRNEFAATLTPQPGQKQGALLLTDLGLATGRRCFYASADLADQPLQVSQRFEVGSESEVRTAYAVLDAASLQPLYLSPSVTRAVKSSLATLTLTCAGPYELYLGDEVISRGSRAQALEVKAPLQKGANVFALKLERGTAALKLQTPGGSSDAGAWKIAPDKAATPTASALDDGAWAKAPQVATDPQLGPVVGVAGQPTVLRRTLLWEKTRLWPTPEPAFYLARGAASHLTFITDGLKGRKLSDWSTYLAVPPDFEILGSTGFYGTNRPTQPQFHCTDLGEQQVQGKPMRVARITADKPILPGQHYIMSQFEAFVRYREAAGEPKSPAAQFLYWSEANGGNLTEPAQSFKVQLLPKLQGAQCKTLVWQLWGGWLSSMDDNEMRRQVLQCAQASGFNDIVGGDRWTSDNAPLLGLRHTLGMNFEPWSLGLTPYLTEHPDQRLLKADGKPSDKLMCTSLLLGAGWPAVEEQLKTKLDAIKPQTMDYDYEYSPYNGPHSCYCPRCLQAFGEYAKLPGTAALTPETIKQQYSAQWVDFMAYRVAQVGAKLKEGVHRLAPGTQFSLYSGYQSADNPERYGIDWRYVGKLRSCDRAGCGYGRPVEAIAATIQALPGIPLLGGALVVPYETSVTTPQTPLNRAWLLRVLLDSTGGVLVYDRLTLDGRSWYAMAETTRLAAAYEQVFLKGQRSALPGLDPGQVQAVSDGKTMLVCAMNQSSKAMTYQIPLPAAWQQGKEFYTAQPIRPGATLKCDVEPGGIVVYVLTGGK